MRRRRQPLAIDLTLIPYHGKPLHHPGEIYKSQAKSGTSPFHAYATAYVIRKGRRFTVALTIETSYRQMHQARIRTCTRDPLLRLLYVGIALLLRNVWLHWQVLAHRPRGGRRIDLGRLSFRKMLVWLQRNC